MMLNVWGATMEAVQSAATSNFSDRAPGAPVAHLDGRRDFWLPDHVYVCTSGGAAVFLDLRKDRYFGLGSAESEALAPIVRNWPESRRRGDRTYSEFGLTVAATLAEQNLLITSEPARRFTCEHHVNLSGDLVSVGDELAIDVPLRSREIFNVIRACASTRTSLRFHSFYSVVRQAWHAKQQGTRSAHRNDVDRIVELVCTFRMLRPLVFNAKDMCLFHALSLFKFLSYYNVYPAWVIGVQLQPWRAHSWCQYENMLLDTNPEKVCEYSPILTV